MWYCDDCGEEFEYPTIGLNDAGVVCDDCPNCGSDCVWNDNNE